MDSSNKDFNIHSLFTKQPRAAVNIDPAKLAAKRAEMEARKQQASNASPAPAAPATASAVPTAPSPAPSAGSAGRTKLSVASESFSPKGPAPAAPSSAIPVSSDVVANQGGPVPVVPGVSVPGVPIPAHNNATSPPPQGAKPTTPFYPSANGFRNGPPPQLPQQQQQPPFHPGQYGGGNRFPGGAGAPYPYMPMNMVGGAGPVPPPYGADGLPMGSPPPHPHGLPLNGPPMGTFVPGPPGGAGGFDATAPGGSPFVPPPQHSPQPSAAAIISKPKTTKAISIKRPDGTVVELSSLTKNKTSSVRTDTPPVSASPTPSNATASSVRGGAPTPVSSTAASEKIAGGGGGVVPGTPITNMAAPVATPAASSASGTPSFFQPAAPSSPAAVSGTPSRAIQIISPVNKRPIVIRKPEEKVASKVDEKPKTEEEKPKAAEEAPKAPEMASKAPEEAPKAVEAPKAAEVTPKVDEAPKAEAKVETKVETTEEFKEAPKVGEKPKEELKEQPKEELKVKEEPKETSKVTEEVKEQAKDIPKESPHIALTPPAPAPAPAPSSASPSASTSSFNLSIKKAKPITDFSTVSYPSNIQPPKLDIVGKKYRYDREFLVQFMKVCKDRPELLPDLEKMGMVEVGPPTPHGGYGGKAPQGGNRGGRIPSHPGASRGGFQTMGQFAPPAGFGGPRRGNNTPSGFGSGGMARAPSGNSGSSFGSSRQRSGGGKRREEYGGGGGGGRGGGHRGGGTMPIQPLSNYAPLEVSENRWVPKSLDNSSGKDDDHLDLVKRKVQALLNKLTLENFDRIFVQILEWADTSKNETDGRTLRQVIALIFLKATDEPLWSEMYARLCRGLMERLSNDVIDREMTGKDGELVRGGILFRKYLLNRCQEDYTNGWKAAAEAAIEMEREKEKHGDEEATVVDEKGEKKPAEFLSDAYFAAQKAKRRGLGLVRFIGELYHLRMVTDRIINACLRQLVDNVTNPDEEDIESLCRLVTTVGKLLASEKNEANLRVCLLRMQEMAKSEHLSARARFMIKDVLDLADHNWTPRHGAQGPKLLAEIHNDVKREKERPKVSSSGSRGIPRGGSRRGGPAAAADGWSNVQQGSRAGDLASFGKVRSNSSNVTLGPQGAFASRNEPLRRGGSSASTRTHQSSRDSGASTPASGNLFSVLQDDAPKTENLLQKEGEEEEEEEQGMSAEEAERKAKTSVEEFFSVRDVSEAVSTVEVLPEHFRGILIDKLLNEVAWKKAEDVALTSELFSAVATRNVLSHEQALESVVAYVTALPDLAIDIPKVYTYSAQLLSSLGLSKEEVAEVAKKMESSDEDDFAVEEGQKKLLEEYEKL